MMKKLYTSINKYIKLLIESNKLSIMSQLLEWPYMLMNSLEDTIILYLTFYFKRRFLTLYSIIIIAANYLQLW